MQSARKLGLLAASFAAALVLAACGGGGGSEPPRTSISRVVVAGDSLADVGTFGYKFTVQNSADPAKGYPIYPELVAQGFGVEGQCAFFRSPDGATFTTTAGCTNYAVGGARIQNTAAQGGETAPYSVPFQLATAATASGGAYTASDLLVVDGGGNDANDLVQSYLGAGTGPAGAAAYQAFLGKLVDATTLTNAFAQPNGAAVAAGIYMQRLADKYYGAIKTNALDKGAIHVAVVNMPDITMVPGFRVAMTNVSAAYGGGATGEAKAAEFKAAVRQWLMAFNTQLQARIGGDDRVALVDLFSDVDDEVANPGPYGLTNVTDSACTVTLGITTAGPACTSAALDASPPSGLAPGWWQTWAFTDGLHPTPLGHRLVGASVSRAIARAGWL